MGIYLGNQEVIQDVSQRIEYHVEEEEEDDDDDLRANAAGSIRSQR